jgi:predicted transglutaminase-like cysteine proteinase
MPLTSQPARLLGSLLALAVLLPGCAPAPLGSPAPRSVAYDYFTAPALGDAWSPKIEGWQERERSARPVQPTGSPASVSGSGQSAKPSAPSAPDLGAKFVSFRAELASLRAEQRRALARQVADWIQAQARTHYVADGAVDHWATLSETLERGGEDCDGLELLVNNFLREVGFAENEVYRAIVYRPADGQHHMVTLWFETEDDPWVIDPTGAMTTGMPHMSELRDWVPLKVFSETREFTVRAAEHTAR